MRAYKITVEKRYKTAMSATAEVYLRESRRLCSDSGASRIIDIEIQNWR